MLRWMMISVVLLAGGSLAGEPAVAAPSTGEPIVVAAKKKKAVRGRSTQRACRPLCRYDDNPCDPISFKLADGRCSYWSNR